MPDKENDNKFMAMLEKMGMVRKLDSDEESEQEYGEPESRNMPSYSPEDEPFPKNAPSRTDDVISNTFNSIRQPVPGMPDPVLPSEKPQAEQYREPERFETPAAYTEPDTFEEPETFDEPEAYDRPAAYVRPSAYEDSRRAPRAEDNRSYRIDQSFWDDPSDNKGLPIEAYTDRFLETEELYSIFSMKTGGTDTVYLIEDYLKSLPDSLPDDSRRDIIIKIIAASGFNYDGLMGDGVARVGKLKEYAEQFAQRTEEYIASRSAELDSLERQIQKIRGLIDRRRELHKKQFFSIEAEAQRLKDLLSFLSE